jgi:pyruvate dehydrogenase E1 component beta subunit
MEVEAVDEGTVGKLLVAEGTEDIPINAPIALILQQGEDSTAVDAKPAAKPPSADEKVEESVRPQAQEQASEMEKAPPASNYRPPAPEPEADPEIPEGTKLVSQTVRDALRDAMAEEMRRDPAVFLFGEEVGEYQGAYKVSQGLLDEFGPKRVVDTPITEYGFTGLAVGAAFTGLKPIVEFMSFNFSMQAIDHVVNSAAKQRYMSGGQVSCPMVFRGPNGAAARVAAQHSQCYASWYAHVPGLKVIAPYSAADAKGLLKAAIRDPDPVIFLENEILYGRTFNVPEMEDFVLPIGKAKVARPGRDVTVVSFSIGMAYALQAAETLAADGIEAEVIDLRSLRPLDLDTVLRSVKKTNRCVTVEEGWPFAGIGSEIAALVQEHGFDWLDAPVLRVTGKDVPLPYAANLEKLALPRPDDVVAAVKAVCYR